MGELLGEADAALSSQHSPPLHCLHFLDLPDERRHPDLPMQSQPHTLHQKPQLSTFQWHVSLLHRNNPEYAPCGALRGVGEVHDDTASETSTATHHLAYRSAASTCPSTPLIFPITDLDVTGEGHQGPGPLEGPGPLVDPHAAAGAILAPVPVRAGPVGTPIPVHPSTGAAVQPPASAISSEVPEPRLTGCLTVPPKCTAGPTQLSERAASPACPVQIPPCVDHMAPPPATQSSGRQPSVPTSSVGVFAAANRGASSVAQAIPGVVIALEGRSEGPSPAMMGQVRKHAAVHAASLRSRVAARGQGGSMASPEAHTSQTEALFEFEDTLPSSTGGRPLCIREPQNVLYRQYSRPSPRSKRSRGAGSRPRSPQAPWDSPLPEVQAVHEAAPQGREGENSSSRRSRRVSKGTQPAAASHSERAPSSGRPAVPMPKLDLSRVVSAQAMCVDAWSLVEMSDSADADGGSDSDRDTSSTGGSWGPESRSQGQQEPIASFRDRGVTACREANKRCTDLSTTSTTRTHVNNHLYIAHRNPAAVPARPRKEASQGVTLLEPTAHLAEKVRRSRQEAVGEPLGPAQSLGERGRSAARLETRYIGRDLHRHLWGSVRGSGHGPRGRPNHMAPVQPPVQHERCTAPGAHALYSQGRSCELSASKLCTTCCHVYPLRDQDGSVAKPGRGREGLHRSGSPKCSNRKRDLREEIVQPEVRFDVHVLQSADTMRGTVSATHSGIGPGCSGLVIGPPGTPWESPPPEPSVGSAVALDALEGPVQSVHAIPTESPPLNTIPTRHSANSSSGTTSAAKSRDVVQSRGMLVDPLQPCRMLDQLVDARLTGSNECMGGLGLSIGEGCARTRFLEAENVHQDSVRYRSRACSLEPSIPDGAQTRAHSCSSSVERQYQLQAGLVPRDTEATDARGYDGGFERQQFGEHEVQDGLCVATPRHNCCNPSAVDDRHTTEKDGGAHVLSADNGPCPRGPHLTLCTCTAEEDSGGDSSCPDPRQHAVQKCQQTTRLTEMH